MTASSFPLIEVRFFTNSGERASGYFLEQFVSGDYSTDKDTFSDYAGMVPNAHPIVLDEFGRCSMFGAPGEAYSFRLINPVTGETEWTRDNVRPAATASSGSYLPLDGSLPMEGPLTLSGPATESLNPVTLEQLNDALTAQLASLTTLTDAATAAAADATAAAAAVKPTVFILADKVGAGATRSIDVQVGTYQCVLETEYSYSEGVNPNYSATPTQGATVGALALSTSSTISRAGGSGYGRVIYGRAIDVQNLVVTAAATISMTMAAAVLGITASRGSKLTVSKIA